MEQVENRLSVPEDKVEELDQRQRKVTKKIQMEHTRPLWHHQRPNLHHRYRRRRVTS
jgi:hypothetical protein